GRQMILLAGVGEIGHFFDPARFGNASCRSSSGRYAQLVTTSGPMAMKKAPMSRGGRVSASCLDRYRQELGGQAMLSARTQFEGVIKSVTLGGGMAEVVGTVGGGLEIVSAITRTSAESLGLKAGDKVRTVIKSTEVLIDKP